MALFSRLITTSKGQELISKLMTGTDEIKFTKIASSSAGYDISELEALTELDDVQQESLVSKVTRVDEKSIKAETSFTNEGVTAGYYMKALGLYADDPDVGEILYAVAIETTGNCYMPAEGGTTVSGAYIQLVTTVGNADSVSLSVDSSAVATIGDIEDLTKRVKELESETHQTKIPWGTCTSGKKDTALTAAISNFELKAGAMVSIRFPNGVPAGATLNINDTGAKPVYYVTKPIVEDVVSAGVLATFLYNGAQYDLVTIDKMAKVVQEVENSEESVPSSAVVYKMQQAIDEEFARYVYKFVDELPESGVTGTIYLVPHSHAESDSYDEYIWLESKSSYEKIGSMDIDLSEYVKSSDLVEITAEELDTYWYNS